MKRNEVNPKIYEVWKHLNNKGVAVAEEWKTLAGFYSWILTSNYKEGLYFVRIDKSLGFYPDNCTWANNRWSVKLLTYKDKTQSMSDWARELGLSRKGFTTRLNNSNLTLDQKFHCGLFVTRKNAKRLYNGLRAKYSRIIQICKNPMNFEYKNYGGVGISVCQEWSNYENFKSWAFSNGYKDGLCLGRIDKTKDFCPSNCIFGTAKELIAYSNHTIKLFDGTTVYNSGYQLAEKLSISPDALYLRLKTAKNLEELTYVGRKKTRVKSKTI